MVDEKHVSLEPEHNETIHQAIVSMDRLGSIKEQDHVSITSAINEIRPAVEGLRAVIGREVGIILKKFEGIRPDSVEDMQAICRAANELLSNLGCKIEFPGTHKPAHLSARILKGAPEGVFLLELKEGGQYQG